MNRRQVLAAAASAPLPLAPAALAVPAPALVIYDPRFETARALVRSLAATGVTPFETGSDVARLWYGPLRAALGRGARPAIRGLTTWADFVVVRGCAAEARLTLDFHMLEPVANAPALVSWTVT